MPLLMCLLFHVLIGLRIIRFFKLLTPNSFFLQIPTIDIIPYQILTEIQYFIKNPLYKCANQTIHTAQLWHAVLDFVFVWRVVFPVQNLMSLFIWLILIVFIILLVSLGIFIQKFCPTLRSEYVSVGIDITVRLCVSQPAEMSRCRKLINVLLCGIPSKDTWVFAETILVLQLICIIV